MVETASVDARRKLVLVRRDNVEHLIMTGAPIDVLIQTEIEGHGQLEPSIETLIIARSGMRPAPDCGKDLTYPPENRRFFDATTQYLWLTVTLKQRWFCLSPKPSCARQDIRTYGRHAYSWQADDVTPV